MRINGRTGPVERGARIAACGTLFALAVLCLPGCRQSPPGGDTKSAKRPVADSPSVDNVAGETDATSKEPPATQPLPASVSPAERGAQLYATNCASCHGERGDGLGIAASYLFPKPRDFRAGRFRVVSTSNNVPTRNDLNELLLRGMPGSSMPPWPHLSQEDLNLLIDQVMQFRREGAREAYLKSLREDEGLTDEEIAAKDVQQEIEEYVAEFSTPGEGTEVPEFTSPTPESLARGKEAYAKFACIQCHGETGRGDGAAPMVDAEQMPTSPRDFTLGIFKASPEPASLYRRIAYGMPGTPMPSSSGMTPEQMVDLVHYIRSLSTEDQRQAAVLNREVLVAKRVDSVPAEGQDEAWSQVEPVRLRSTPLWWRNDSDPGMAVQAMHDGKQLAIRMTWKDSTRDGNAVRGESFRDAVAMELSRGEAEPFLGMGSLSSPVDVWYWNAAHQGPAETLNEVYPHAVVDNFPFSEAASASAELDRPGARLADQPDLSLPARASGNQIVPREGESGGSALAAGGPKTATFRPPLSQLVRAHGEWKDDRWTVVMTRPLSVPSPTDGLALDPEGKASVAFAIWDGAHRDRNGQKAITVWQELKLE